MSRLSTRTGLRDGGTLYIYSLFLEVVVSKIFLTASCGVRCTESGIT